MLPEGAGLEGDQEEERKDVEMEGEHIHRHTEE